MIDRMPRNGFVSRVIATIVLVAYTTVSTAPPAHALPTLLLAQTTPHAAPEKVESEDAEEDRGHTWRIAVQLKQLELQAGDATRRREAQASLRELQQELAKRDARLMAEFDDIGSKLKSSELPASILQRHQDAVDRFKAQSDEIQKELSAVAKTENTKQLRDTSRRLRERLEAQPEARRQQPLPRQLPFATPEQRIRAPKSTSEDFAELFTPQAVPGLRLASTSPRALLLAAQATLATAEYLTASEDVQITPQISALAAQLDHDPIKIYQWVRNQIDFVPSYGSIQGSARTLVVRQGNAVDTASLLIALLRASNIPARYVYGTVEIPIEQVMNWVGGVESRQGALDLLAQGGVPVQGLAQGGVIKLARLEHVWVEAFVDFYPSRGAKNRAPDAWIPMDASFKQYEFVPGVDVGQRPLPTQLAALTALIDQVQYDVTTGGLNGLSMQSALQFRDEAQGRLNEYLVASEALSLAPMRERRVSELLSPVLAASLPYRVVAAGIVSATPPTALKRAFKLQLYTSVQNQQYGSPAISFTSNLPALAGKRLSIQFTPTTEDDAATLRSFMPEPSDGTIDPSELPRSIPGYLVHLDVRLLLDEVEVSRTNGFVLGQEIASTLEIQKHDGTWHSANNIGTAGEFIAVSLDLQGTGSDQLDWDETRSADAMLHATAHAYWAHASEHLKVLSGLGVAVAYRQPSFGMFGTRLDPIYSYGIPRQVQFAGTEVDIDALLTSVVAMDGSEAARIKAVTQIGIFGSSLESDVPQVYLSAGTNTRGASAISTIAAAVAEGQPLYEITSANVGAALAAIQQSAEVEADIQQAVLAGNRVRVSRSPVTIGAWRGAGYIIEDLPTGSAAYRISGGANGGSTPDPIGDALTAVGLGMLNVIVPPAIASSAEQPCDDDNNREQHKINWQLILFMALLTAMLLAASAGSGGAAVPAAVAALAILIPAFLAVTAAHASPGQCPIFFPGSVGGTGPMEQVTAHISSAQGSGSPGVLTYMGIDVIEEIVNRSWYNLTPECNVAARAAYSAAHGGAIGACDEYPFASTYQGGALNYGPPNNYVSLRLLDFGQNSRAGAVMRWFFVRCGVQKNGRFEVRPTGGVTTGRDSRGLTCYP